MPPIRAAEACESQLGVGGQVEVEQQRLAVVAQQDVGRLEVAMEDAALVGVGQPVGQAGDQPEDRLDVTEPADALELGGRPDLGRCRDGGRRIARGRALRRPAIAPSDSPAAAPSRTTGDGDCSAGPRRNRGASGSASTPGGRRRRCRSRGRACRPPGAARCGGPSRSGRCWCAAIAPGRGSRR